MCCITRYVIKHFYVGGCKCCGLITHGAHSVAHLVLLCVCECAFVCVGLERGWCPVPEPVILSVGAAALTNCLFSHLGCGYFGGGFFVNNVISSPELCKPCCHILVCVLYIEGFMTTMGF